MALIDIINRAIDLATQAYDAFFTQVVGLTPFVDRWYFTSSNPCVFCRHMQAISQTVDIPPGGRFPAPNYTIVNYLSALDLTFVEHPPAHDDCHCIRVTEPKPGFLPEP